LSHYFIHDENLESNIVEIEYEFQEVNIKLKTDNGLFSKEHVDYATNILLHELPPLKGKVLDLGCGYGPIGISLAKTNTIMLTMADINNKAIEFSKVNCESNHVQAEFVESDGFQNIEGMFDFIILNPPIHAGKQTIYQMYEDAYKHLQPNGRFYLIIQKKHGAKSTIEKLDAIYDTCKTIYKKKGFYILEAIKE